MASSALPIRGSFNPSNHPDSDTPYASEPSDLDIDSSIPPTNDHHHLHHHHHTQEPDLSEPAEPSKRHRIPSLTIRSRAFSSSSSSASSSSVRRKPLPLTASPLATRLSSGEHLASTLELPEQTFVRPYSVDSPTLYEFPSKSTIPFSPARFSEPSEHSL